MTDTESTSPTSCWCNKDLFLRLIEFSLTPRLQSSSFSPAVTTQDAFRCSVECRSDHRIITAVMYQLDFPSVRLSRCTWIRTWTWRWISRTRVMSPKRSKLTWPGPSSSTPESQPITSKMRTSMSPCRPIRVSAIRGKVLWICGFRNKLWYS